jgi:hypothetical protein
MSIDPKFMDLVLFIVGWVFGLFAFSQITYPLVTLIPKVRRLLQDDQYQKTMLLYLLLLAPSIWTVVLVSSVILVFRYYAAYSKSYLAGLGIVFVLVLFNLYKRNREIEDDFIFRLKNYIRLSKEDSLINKYPQDKRKG